MLKIAKMATATENQSLQNYSPQEILQEVRTFIHGANYKIQNQRQRDALAQSALILLRTLPTARHAVLEYLACTFDEAVNNYLLEMDIGHNVSGDGGGQSVSSFLHDACGVLHTFIHTHSAAWAPIISSWSLDLLGHISSKYADRRGVPHNGSLNELLQLWLTCKPTKLLIEVATECFAQMIGGAPENCVDALLAASVQYSPHFDWVVAHIGSSFPCTIISRVLMCGLKDYCQHGNHGNGDSDNKIPKMGSVVGILGHLASKHGHDIRDALMKLFKESLEDSGDQGRVTTVPFLLQLASMSPLLLHILATDLVKALTVPVLSRLHVQFQPWMATYPHEFDSLMTLVVHLVMQTDTGADKCLEFLLYNATANMDNTLADTPLPLPDVQKTCALLIDQILSECQVMVFRRDSGLDVPFLGALGSLLPQLTQDMLNNDGKRSKWLQTLLCHIILYKGERHGAETLAFILAQAETEQQLGQLVRIQQKIEIGMPRVIQECVQLAVDLLQHKDTNIHILLNNMYLLAHWESTGPQDNVRSKFKDCLEKHWVTLSKLLIHSDFEVAMVTLKLLNHVTSPSNMSCGSALQVCGSVVALFFRILDIQETSSVQSMVLACKRCAKFLSKKTYTQSILVRYLIEGALDQENKYLFGGKMDLGTATSGSRDSHTSLMSENKSHGLSLTTLRSHSSVFHAGVIGQGLRQRSGSGKLTKETVRRNISCLQEMLWVCCHDYTSPAVVTMETDDNREPDQPLKSYSLRISPDLCRMIGNLIVELSTPDVLYNNRFWPEEESLKMTVERDLQVWKVFHHNPVLWDILQLMAANTLVMSRCSTVLKSLTAILMHYFESSREKMAANSPKHLECVCNIVRCLGKSGLLPSPLSALSELFPFVTPFESFLLLLALWRYMKENPPTEDPSEVTRRVCESRHTDVVLTIVHKHIDTVGHLYATFFRPNSPAPPMMTIKTEPVVIE